MQRSAPYTASGCAHGNDTSDSVLPRLRAALLPLSGSRETSLAAVAPAAVRMPPPAEIQALPQNCPGSHMMTGQGHLAQARPSWDETTR